MDYQVNEVIELVRMEDPNPIPVGTKGIVKSIAVLPRDEVQLGVDWDNGRRLSVILPHDQIKRFL